MSAIYQRARPIHWDEVVGQEHIKDVLRAALEKGRVGHAYLFSGPRGVGKTTTARLIAMTANCTGPEPKPCGECEHCRAVRAGSHPDVLEIDAASNNSVDDVRDLREKVGLAPMRGGKKIYILDEAHMMSRQAFNALLKTLEEPPEHVIFILATTEPEKILPTILSRTQHYRFRRLTPEEIAGKLSGLAQAEGLSAEPAALELIGRLADGAMRDGESLLERMLAAGTAVTRRAVEEALGLPPGEQMRRLAAALAQGDAATALADAGELYRAGFAARTVVEGLVEALSQAIHAELGVGGGPGLEAARLEGVDLPRLLRLQAGLDEQESRFARSADQLSLELALTHALLAADGGGSGGSGSGTPGEAGRATTPSRAPAPADTGDANLAARLARLERELAALQASGATPAPGAGAGAASVGGTGGTAAAAVAGRAAAGASAGAPAPRRSAAAARPAVPQVPAAPSGNWADVMSAVSMQMRAFLKPARMYAEAGYVSLSYDARGSFHAKQILSKLDELGPLVERVFGPVTLEIITAESGGGRTVVLGGSAPGTPTQTSTASSAAPRPSASGAASVADGAPTPAGAVAGTAAGTVQAGTAQASTAQAGRPSEDTLDDFDPLARRVPRSAAARPVPPPSPDDAAPAPLPSQDPPPWEAADVGEVPAVPADIAQAENLGGAAAPAGRDDAFQGGPAQDGPAQKGTAQDGPPQHGAGRSPVPVTGAASAERELYLGEPVTEEPQWDDLGMDMDGGPVVPVRSADAPGEAERAAAPAPATAAPTPARRPAAPAPASAAPGTAAPASASAGSPQDIRTHPMFEDIRGRFSGRVREIGKNRHAPAAEAPGADDDAAAEA